MVTGSRQKVLCLATIEWDFLWQRHQTFMKQFADAGYEVVFVENTGFRNPGLKDLKRVFGILEHLFKKKVSGTKVNPLPENIHIIRPIVLPPNGFVFRWLNKRIFIPKLIKQNGLNEYFDICVAYLPSATTVELLNQIKPAFILFDYVANFSGHPEKPRDFDRIEQSILKISNLVVTDSDFLFQQLRPKHEHVKQIHQGVDVTLFSSVSIENKAEYNKFCFFGAIDDRIDWDIVINLLNHGFHIDFIGTVKTSYLPEGINVYPAVSHDQLPAMVSAYDGLIIPYKVNEFTNGIIPAKIYECLATGMPLLVSDMPSFQRLSDVVYICRNSNDFKEKAEGLLDTETKELLVRRRTIAAEQSTEVNFKKLLNEIELLANE